jgi:hypothetical protein
MALTTSIKKRAAQINELRERALSLGQVCSPIERLAKGLATGLARRLAQRVGEFIFQTVAFSLDNFTVDAATQLLPAWLVTCDNATVKTWVADTSDKVTEVFSPLLLMQSEYACGGSSRALRTASDKVIRVVATPMPDLVISWADVKETDRLYINFQYVLFDEAGELHPPKNGDKCEIELDGALETALRQQVFSDLSKMYEKGLPLAPGFLRQLGREEEALATEAMLCNRPQMRETSEESTEEESTEEERGMLTLKSSGSWEIDRIVDQKPSTGRARWWYLVRWAGYHPTWEAWRINGNPADPIETWEPETVVLNTEAMVAWREAQAGQ